MSHEPTNGRQSEAVTDSAVRGATRCRHCDAPLSLTVVDLGKSPLCQTVLTAEQTGAGRDVLPAARPGLRALLARPDPRVRAPGGHLHRVRLLLGVLRLLGGAFPALRRRDDRAARSRAAESLVVELASNDGYLLQHFLPKGIPVLGIEPAVNVAEAAVERGVETLTEFFTAELGRELAAERGHADLVLGNNVLAQVPDINDFAAGIAALLASDGTATFEFPHLANLIERLEYDTIYHEHFSYFSLHSHPRRSSARRGSTLVDVEELPSHGGSLRVFLRHAEAGVRPSRGRRGAPRRRGGAGAPRPRDVPPVRRAACGSRSAHCSSSSIALRREGKQVVGYGAPGKGNTLLNYCGIRTDFLDYTVDRNPYKQGKLHARDAHPDPSARADRRDEAGRDPHPAVEPRERDPRAAVVHGGLGRAARDSRFRPPASSTKLPGRVA